MLSLEELCAKVEAYAPKADLDPLRDAYLFSEKAHQDQVRESGEPYFSHPVEVAAILADMQLDVVCVSVGLLHDVVEDTLTTVERIQELFGDDIAILVDGVTKLSKIQFSSKKEKQVENFRKLLLAMVKDIRVILVKLADRLHNMRTLGAMSREKQKSIARETIEIYAPIAHRLGIARIRGELEDLAFGYLDPASFKRLGEQVSKKLAHSDGFIRGVIKRIESTFQDQGIEALVQSRIKRSYSISAKMKRQNIELDQVYDFYAFRLILPSIRDCYTALGAINNMWNPVPDRIKDYIAIPRPNMYQSLHTTVLSQSGQPFEVQIRTPAMHRVAEEGIASHWKYKEGIQVPAEETQFGWLRRVLEWQKEVKDPHQFLSNLKIDLYPKEVYIFTPKGEVMTLSKGSTPVDFAYAIHTEIGHRCLGAKINGRLLPLKSRLKNGDRVEILTSNQSRPRRGWLEFVKTSKARHAIRHWLTQRQRKHAEILGRKLYEKEARKYEISPKRYRKKLKELLPTWNFKEPEDLYAALGFGKLPASVVIKQLAPERTIRQPKGEESRLEKVVRRVLGRQDDGILVQGESDLMVSRAKCCNAIRGEEIIGYITVGRGISVHALTCRNVENLLLNPERTIEVEWASDTEEDRYAVPLRVYTEDRRGMLADISNAISNIKTNIVNATADTVEGRFGLFDLTVEVTDTAHLDRVVNVIKGIEGVRDVDRAGNRAREVGA